MFGKKTGGEVYREEKKSWWGVREDLGQSYSITKKTEDLYGNPR